MPSSDETSKWFLYVVECSDDTFYTGVTTSLLRRIKEHNSDGKGAKYTKTRQPVKLIYWKIYIDRSEAQKAEFAFKKLSRQQKTKKIFNENTARLQNLESLLSRHCGDATLSLHKFSDCIEQGWTDYLRSF